MWRRQAQRTAVRSGGARGHATGATLGADRQQPAYRGDTGETGDTADEASWNEIRTRARVVHALACAGATFAELARLAGDDPVVVMAAIAYEDVHPRDYDLLTRDVVVARLRRLMLAVAPTLHMTTGPDEWVWAPGRDPFHPSHVAHGRDRHERHGLAVSVA